MNQEINPISTSIKIGQDAFIASGSFKGSIVKICSLPSKKELISYYLFLVQLGKSRFQKKILSFNVFLEYINILPTIHVTTIIVQQLNASKKLILVTNPCGSYDIELFLTHYSKSKNLFFYGKNQILSQRISWI